MGCLELEIYKKNMEPEGATEKGAFFFRPNKVYR